MADSEGGPKTPPLPGPSTVLHMVPKTPPLSSPCGGGDGAEAAAGRAGRAERSSRSRSRERHKLRWNQLFEQIRRARAKDAELQQVLEKAETTNRVKDGYLKMVHGLAKEKMLLAKELKKKEEEAQQLQRKLEDSQARNTELRRQLEQI
eukprot:5149808-Alexandrium_andersonii.AAC.1